jgi:ABC-type glycerol-3-phosphate transport system substrate-binding protein
MAKNPLSRREFLALSAALSASVVAACAAPAVTTQSPAQVTIEPISVSHWVYSDLPLDRDTLTSVPADRTENVVKYFDWSLEKFREESPEIEVQLEYLPHDQSWFAKLDSSLIAGTPPDVVQGPVSEAAKYIPLGALSPIDDYISPEIKADLHEAIVAEASFDDRQYLWPWRLSFGGGIQINSTI